MFELRTVPGHEARPRGRVAVCVVSRAGRERYLSKTLAHLRKQDAAILLWMNGGQIPTGRLDWAHAHPFNVGQHIAHNEMLDECVRMGVDWHIRVDDDFWPTTRTWLKRLLKSQEDIKNLTGSYTVMGMTIDGLNNPPLESAAYELGRERAEIIDIMGGIFRMSPMSIMRYFRWDERQAMGMGDATQFSKFCKSIDLKMIRIATVHATHGDSTFSQQNASPEWSYEHDMLQHTPFGL